MSLPSEPTSSTAFPKLGSSIYYACLFLSEKQRTSLAPLLQIIWRIERIPRFCNEPEVVNTQLQWWQSEISEAFKQQPTHPLMIKLSNIIKGLENLSPNQALSQQVTVSLLGCLNYLLDQQQDCQLDDFAAWVKHSEAKRYELIVSANLLIQAEGLTESMNSLASQLLSSLDVVDGFHRDAKGGVISLPLELLIKHQVTIDELIDPEQDNHHFWKLWTQQITHLYQQFWQLSQHSEAQHSKQHTGHPLVEVILIYSGIRLAALKKSLSSKSSHRNNCYNLRPQISPLQKFWLSWRIHSRWSSGKKPLRILTP